MSAHFSMSAEVGITDVVLIAGLGSSGTEEVYHWIDFRTRSIVTDRIPIAAQRAAQLRVLHDQLGTRLPYGVTSAEALLPYFLHPHSFVALSSGEVVVSFKQAPYFRILAKGSFGRLHPAEPDYSVMLSSTNCEVSAGVVGYTAVRAADRYARYCGGTRLFGGHIYNLAIRSANEQGVGVLPAFIKDTLHQLAYSSAGFYVGVDMSLDAASDWSEKALKEFDVDAYAAGIFPKSGFAVYDTATERSIVQFPGIACAAHVTLDPTDPTIFYISCHNISKWQNNVIVHGPGSLERYRFANGQLSLLGTFTDASYFRVTSQEIFIHQGRKLAAATGYPNHLYLIDADTMTLVDKFELFPAPVPSPPFACEKNSASPLYLVASSDGRYIVMSGASELFVVDVGQREVVHRMAFATGGEFAATAHIGLVPR